jgi:hypothetical protein
MAEVSNNVLAGLFLVAIVITVIGLVSLYSYPSLTGFASQQTGYANVTITGQASINLWSTVTDFGDGVPPSTAASVRNISTNQVNTGEFNNGSGNNGTDWGTDAEGEGFAYAMILYNDGNTDVNVTITSNESASDMMDCSGGTCEAPEHFEFFVVENESGSVAGDLWGQNATADWWELSTSALPLVGQLQYTNDNQNSIQIHYRLSIPNDAGTGGKRAQITFDAVQS